MRAAVDEREAGADILIMARTDARATDGLEEAIWRGNAFRDAGVDILFIEAPESEAEMERICREAPGHHMANLVEQGKTPVLPAARLDEIGYKLAVYPVTLLSAGIRAMQDALAALQSGRQPVGLLDFADLCDVVGFNDYYDLERRYTEVDR